MVDCILPVAFFYVNMPPKPPPPRYDDASPAATAFSCSFICLVQLRPCQLGFFSLVVDLLVSLDVLPTGVESVRPGHLVSEFAVGAQVPGEGCEADDHSSENSSVDFPVRWLRVPATRW